MSDRITADPHNFYLEIGDRTLTIPVHRSDILHKVLVSRWRARDTHTPIKFGTPANPVAADLVKQFIKQKPMNPKLAEAGLEALIGEINL